MSIRTTPELGIFALHRYDVANVTSIEMTDSLRIVTDQRPWAHAIEFRPRIGSDVADGPVVVIVDVNVEFGQIEVGALSDTGSVFLACS